MEVYATFKDMPPQTITDPLPNWSCWQHNIHHGLSRRFHTCHTCSVWAGSPLWREQGASGGPANFGVLWWMPIKMHGAGLWAQIPLEDASPHVALMESVCDSLVRNMHTVSWYLLEYPAGRHNKPSSTARMDVPSCTCATWLGCRYLLMLPVVTRTLSNTKL